MEPKPLDHDALSPVEIARKVERVGVAKAHTDALTLVLLAILAGAFISMGCLFYLVVTTESHLGFGPLRFFGGLAFCLGLILVVVAGAELFTGNNLIAMAWASRLIGGRDVLRNWLIVYVGNVVGCLGTVGLAWAANLGTLAKGAVGSNAIQVATAKSQLSIVEEISRGLLCNALVCLAVWLTMSGRSVADKILAILFPVTAFVALGLEHSIANWFFLPYGLLLDQKSAVSMPGVTQNLVFVSLGNIVGGTLMVAGIYWVAYLRTPKPKS